ncbi:MAG TPA: hypothetical protein VFS38_02300, partial [Actinomycetota bacterium]|nr:hypothetical protein [Actinomycetota bacterium]
KVTARAELMFRSVEEARRARASTYYMYLMSTIDNRALKWAMSRPHPKAWWTPPAELIRAGVVRISGWDTNAAFATATVSIPEVPSGRYYVMLCSAACREPLADLVPERIQVVDDSLSARTARKVETTKYKVQLALQRIRHDRRQEVKRRRAAETALAQVVRDVASLRRRTDSLNDVPRSVPWIAYLGWFTGGVGWATAAGMTRRRRAARVTGSEGPLEHLPSEERELVGSSTKR